MTPRRKKNELPEKIVEMAYQLLHPPDSNYSPKLPPLELVELREAQSSLRIENQDLDPMHAYLLAQASIAHHVAQLFAKTRPLPDETINAIWAQFDFLFQLLCAPKLIGSPDDTKPTKSYAEVASIIGRFVSEHLQELPLRRGRSPKAPPDRHWFIGIDELAGRLRNARQWSRDSPQVALPRPRDPECSEFLEGLRREEPVEAALHVAWLVAKNRFDYDGSRRAFSDAWRDWKRDQQPA